MPMFLIQSAILIAIAFIIGCIIGCILRRMFASDTVAAPAATAAVATTAAVASVAALKPEPAAEPESTPEPAAAPEPAKIAEPASVMAAAPKPKAPAKPRAAATLKAKPVSKPKTVSKPAPVAKPKIAAAPAKPDDLKLIVGIGPVNERKLNALGVSRFAHIAAWSPKDEAEYGHKLEFPGRIEREEWVRQAKKLASGGVSEDKAEIARKSGVAKPAGLIGSPAVKSAKPAAKPAASAKPAPVKSVAAKPVATSQAVAKPAAAKPAKPAPKPKAAKQPMAAKLAAPVGGKPDNLTLINGIGNVIEKKLHAMGVFHFEQIANWSKAQAEEFSKAVGFPGRAEREAWMKEAAIFMKGGTTDHARKVEAGSIPTSRKSTAAEKGKKK